MNAALFLFFIYLLFLLWHRRWFSKPLSKEEVGAIYDKHDSGVDDTRRDQERENVRSFLETDDGKPFYMVNLMQYRDKAFYPDGECPEVETGRQANALYSRAVVKELIKCGSYPVFLSGKIGNLLNSAGTGTDFFEEVGIVRYRSRRDMLNMASSPSFLKAEPHKWASMEKTVVVPSRRMVQVDLGVIVPIILLLAWAIMT